MNLYTAKKIIGSAMHAGSERPTQSPAPNPQPMDANQLATATAFLFSSYRPAL